MFPTKFLECYLETYENFLYLPSVPDSKSICFILLAGHHLLKHFHEFTNDMNFSLTVKK